MPVYKDFQKIPQFIRNGHYQVNVPFDYIETWLEDKASNRMFTLDLEPDFQRAHVWTDEKRIAYMEYLLQGGTFSRTLLWNCPGWMQDFRGPLQIVDGKQRLETVRRFMRSELKAFGTYFKDYTGRINGMEYGFVFQINNLPTRKEILQWYLQLNSGGVVHTEEELDKVRQLLAKERKNG